MVPGGLRGVTIPHDWLWMKGSTEQPQYPHRARTVRASQQVLPLRKKYAKNCATIGHTNFSGIFPILIPPPPT